MNFGEFKAIYTVICTNLQQFLRIYSNFNNLQELVAILWNFYEFKKIYNDF
jgi:hypothetical protein